MRRRQTFPRLEKRPGAVFCFLRSEKRPAIGQAPRRAPTQEPETCRQVSLCVVFCQSLPKLLDILVCPAGVSWSWDMAVTYSYWCLLYSPFSWQSFAVVGVETCRITCCRGSRAIFTFVHVVAATLQLADGAQATLVNSVTYLVHSPTPYARTASPFRVLSNIAYVMQVDSRPVLLSDGLTANSQLYGRQCGLCSLVSHSLNDGITHATVLCG